MEDEQQAKQFFELLGNSVVEIRAIARDGSIQSAYFDRADEFAETAAGLTMPDVSGVYVTINELAPDFRELATNLIGPARRTTADSHITRLVTLFVEIDPTREHPDGGRVCANDAEHQTALDAGHKLAAHVKALGWPEPLIVDSGNGVYLIFRIDLPNVRASVDLIRLVLESLAAYIDNEAAHVDTSVWNPARIIRIAGSINRKSIHTQDRPNRPVRILSAPARLQELTLSQLNALATTNIQPEAEVVEAPANEFEQIEDEIYQQRVLKVGEYLNRAGAPVTGSRTEPRFTAYDLAYCPFKGPEHKKGRTAVLVWRDGSITISCFHGQCRGKRSFDDLQEALGLPFEQTAGVKRAVDDPLALADQFLADRQNILTHFWGDTFRYTESDGWTKTCGAEMEPIIRPTVQQALDQHSKTVGKKSKAIRGGLVSDVYKAVQSLVRREVPRTTIAPFWLTDHEWDSRDLIVLDNGIFNVRAFLDGQEHFAPLTPDLFYQHRAAFSFDSTAGPPVEWLKFLDSLEREPEWSDCLQQVAGYVVSAGYDLQKFIMIYGPPRAGKNVIADTLAQLVGESAVCGLRLQDFASEFGLENAVGKRLGIIPEIDTPSQHAREIVARIKAVTGGDVVTVNQKRIKALSLKLPIKLLMLSNFFTPLPDGSGALQARCLPLKLVQSFRGREDLELSNKIKRELPSVFNWALEGLRKLHRAGGQFTLPESSEAEWNQFNEESAPLQAFVSDCAILDPKKAVQSPALFTIYKVWLDREHSDETPLSEVQFAHELRAAVPAITKDRSTKANERWHRGREIVATPYDDTDKRVPLWLGIYPQPEWCFETRRDAQSASHLRWA